MAGSGPTIIFLKKMQYLKIFKNHLKKIMIISNIFLFILHNIEFYIYTIKYKFGIKIPFSHIISKKKHSKHFQKEKNILLHTAKS
jgi:hypothetical protein